MDQNLKNHYSAGKIVLGVIIALIIGALVPVVMTLQISMMTPMVMLGGLMMVLLFCFAGPAPALVLGVMQIAASAYFFSPVFGWIVLFMSVMPAWVAIRGIGSKQPFFKQMQDCLSAQTSGLLIAVIIAYVSFGGDMISKLIDAIRTEFARMPEELISSIVDGVNSTMVSMGFQESTLTVDAYRELVSGAMLDYLQESYTRILPGSLIVGAVFTAVISVFWGNWRMARKGLATSESFVGMSAWFLPGHATGGLIFVWAASYVLMAVGYKSGENLYQTVYMLNQLVFSIQALASFNRGFLKKGVRTGKRCALTVIIWIASMLMPGLGIGLMFIGIASALWGSHGMITLRMKQQHDNDSDNND